MRLDDVERLHVVARAPLSGRADRERPWWRPPLRDVYWTPGTRVQVRIVDVAPDANRVVAELVAADV